MKCKIAPGQHVLCIENEVPDPMMRGNLVLPEVGKIYTVARVSIGEIQEIPCIELEEIGEQVVWYVLDGVLYEGFALFDYRCFKPLPKLSVKDFLTDLVRA